MTIATTNRRVSASGNGVTTAFAVTFEFFEDTTLVVTLVAADGTETVQTLTTHYTVSGGNGSTGTVTMVTAPASGETLVIQGNQPQTQPSDYTDFSDFPANTLETNLDKLTLMVQDVEDATDLAIQAPITRTPGSDPLRVPEPEDGKFMRGKSDLTGWENADINTLGAVGIPVSVAEGGTAATTAADARDNLGLETISQAEAEAGTATTERAFTAQRVGQAIQALALGRLVSIQTFNSSGTWTKPANVTRALVFATGGGGAGGGNASSNGGSGGGAAGTTIELIDVSATSSVTVTIGAGGTGVSAGGGNSGGTTTFGAFVTANGGTGGQAGVGPGGGGGTASASGDVNLGGGDGIPGTSSRGGNGGPGFWGGGGRGAGAANTGSGGKTPGSGGGGGGPNASSTGGGGGPGLVVVFEFE